MTWWPSKTRFAATGPWRRKNSLNKASRNPRGSKSMPQYRKIKLNAMTLLSIGQSASLTRTGVARGHSHTWNFFRAHTCHGGRYGPDGDVGSPVHPEIFRGDPQNRGEKRGDRETGILVTCVTVLFPLRCDSSDAIQHYRKP